MIESILMVCTGNICRSPVAEYEMRRIAPQLQVASAGIAAVEDAGADRHMTQLARADGLDLSGHVARQISGDVIYGYDLIIAMDRQQRDWLIHRFPEDRGRVVLMTRWSGGRNIPDPYRRSAAVYRLVYDRVRQCCEEWSQRLLSTA